MKKLLYLGPKPPPVSGYANVVVEMHKCFAVANIPTTFISTVPCFLAFLFPGRIWQFCRSLYLALLLPLVALLLPFRRGTYQSLNGGIGLLFDLACVAWARVLRKDIYLHHHSFSYLQRRSTLAALVFAAAGGRATHAVNCDVMKRRLQQLYKSVCKVHVVSNAAILAEGDPSKFVPAEAIPTRMPAELDGAAPNQHPLKLGFMAYFNREKGLDTFCETVKSLRERGVSAVGIAVGPVHDAELTASLSSEFSEIVEFRKPAYGKDRDAFFNEIDLLLFPSRYANEAEPLTIYHALAAGVPVVATDVGCLRDMLAGVSFCATVPRSNFLKASVEHILSNCQQLLAWASVRAAMTADFQAILERNRQDLQSLLRLVSEPNQR